MGVAFLSTRNYSASREPLEAALQMAPDDKFRIKVYEALLPAYRQLGEIDKFVEACDFLIAKSPTAAQQSITRRALLGFVFERGKLDDLAGRYEDALKKDPQDRTALYVLSELYSRAKPNPGRAAELIERLAKLDQKSDQPGNVLQSANLAVQYVKAKKYKEGAELYEKIAPLDESWPLGTGKRPPPHGSCWDRRIRPWRRPRSRPRARRSSAATCWPTSGTATWPTSFWPPAKPSWPSRTTSRPSRRPTSRAISKAARSRSPKPARKLAPSQNLWRSQIPTGLDLGGYRSGRTTLSRELEVFRSRRATRATRFFRVLPSR